MPPRCLISGKILQGDVGLSAEIFLKFYFISDPFCKKCGSPLISKNVPCPACHNRVFDFDQGRSAFLYTEETKDLLLKFKHGDALFFAPTFIKWLKRCGSDLTSSADIIVPVPLHYVRLWKRGYNQSAILAKGLSKKKVILDLLLRNKNTPTQENKTAEQRYINIMGAFSINPKHAHLVKNKNVLLIDDVLTSGATASFCAKELKKYGAKEVNLLTLARVPL